MSNLIGQEKEIFLGAQKRHEQAPTITAPCRIDGMQTGNNTFLLKGSFPIAIC
jgi:hypothetical protein